MDLLYTFVFCTAIAAFLTIIGFGGTFLENMVFSQGIGLTTCLFCLTGSYISLQVVHSKSWWTHVLISCPAWMAGVAGGIVLGESAVNLMNGEITISGAMRWQIAAIGLLFSSLAGFFLFTKQKLAASKEILQEERIKRLSIEKLALETNLKRLQAQVEPHFLFNTLSNIVGLMDSDPATAKSMQLNLIQYLRTTLSRTRTQTTTLGQESDLIRSYLEIYKIRMGPRLEYTIDIPPALINQPFPPLLLQPIVENAVRHGLEPKIEGGRIEVCARAGDGRLSIEISDSGGGMAASGGAGLGLINVRERLDRLFGGQGRLTIEPNDECGVKVVIDLPLEQREIPDGPYPD